MSNLQLPEQELFDGALNVAVQLAASENEQHKGLGQIIAGLCAIIEKRAITSHLSLRSGSTKESEEAARLHRKAFNIVSALAATPVAEWASKAEINSCLDDFRPPTPSDQKTHVQELMDSRAPGDMPSPLEFHEAFDADQKKG